MWQLQWFIVRLSNYLSNGDLSGNMPLDYCQNEQIAFYLFKSDIPRNDCNVLLLHSKSFFFSKLGNNATFREQRNAPDDELGWSKQT